MDTIPGPVTVIMDTNFLLIPYQFRLDVFAQMRGLVDLPHVVIPRTVIDELEAISKNMGRQGAAARFALLLLSREKWNLVDTNVVPDRWIAEYARQHRAVVCTNDRGLRLRLRRLKTKLIVLRHRARLGVV